MSILNMVDGGDGPQLAQTALDTVAARVKAGSTTSVLIIALSPDGEMTVFVGGRQFNNSFELIGMLETLKHSVVAGDF